jgi:hypothetical protein
VVKVLKAALAGTSKKTKKRNCVCGRGVFPGHYDCFTIRRVFAMERALTVIPIVLSCSACISHPAQFQSLTVKVEKNAPCFGVSNDTEPGEVVLVYEPSISRRAGNEWESIFSPGAFPSSRFLKSEECLRWDKVDWQSGEYDVVLESRNHNTIVRYATRFILSINSRGELSLVRIE